MSTDGQVYWSDTHQLSQYIEGYHDAIDRQLGAGDEGVGDDLRALRSTRRSAGLHGRRAQ